MNWVFDDFVIREAITFQHGTYVGYGLLLFNIDYSIISKHTCMHVQYVELGRFQFTGTRITVQNQVVFS